MKNQLAQLSQLNYRCPKPQIATLPLAAGARTQVMGLMGEWPVYSMVGVHERSVIDSDNRRIEANRWVFWGRWEGHAIEFACRIAVFAQLGTGAPPIAAGLGYVWSPENFEREIFGVFRTVMSMRIRRCESIGVANGFGVWPGNRSGLRGVFGVGVVADCGRVHKKPLMRRAGSAETLMADCHWWRAGGELWQVQ